MNKIAELAQKLADSIADSRVQVRPIQVINENYDASWDVIITVNGSRQIFCICKEDDDYFWFKTY